MTSNRFSDTEVGIACGATTRHGMPSGRSILASAFLLLFLATSSSSVAWAQKKVAQSGMTFLGISLGARQCAMGDAAVASVRGIEGLFYNQATLADVDGFAAVANHVNWLVDTKLYGIGAAYGLGRWGTAALDVVYMDWGFIQGTQRVDKSVNERGFQLTGDIGVEEYAVGLSYAYRVSDRVAFGGKMKWAHEDLGEAGYVTGERQDPETGQEELQYASKHWSLTHVGFDFGGLYFTGYKSLAFAFAFQNFSTGMEYYVEQFQMPFTIRMGLSMDVVNLIAPESERVQWNISVDALHPIDNLERVYLGSETVIMDHFALRGGYKFGHDVESLSFGLGVMLEYGDAVCQVDYAYGSTELFRDVSRFSLGFGF